MHLYSMKLFIKNLFRAMFIDTVCTDFKCLRIFVISVSNIYIYIYFQKHIYCHQCKKKILVCELFTSINTAVKRELK